MQLSRSLSRVSCSHSVGAPRVGTAAPDADFILLDSGHAPAESTMIGRIVQRADEAISSRGDQFSAPNKA